MLTAGPMVASLYLSFTDYGVEQIAGVRADEHASGSTTTAQLLDDPKVATSLKNTFIYTVMTVPAKMAVALGLAMILARLGLRGRASSGRSSTSRTSRPRSRSGS